MVQVDVRLPMASSLDINCRYPYRDVALSMHGQGRYTEEVVLCYEPAMVIR